MRYACKVRLLANGKETFQFVTVDAPTAEKASGAAVAETRARHPHAGVSCHKIVPAPRDDPAEPVTVDAPPRRPPGRPRKVLEAAA